MSQYKAKGVHPETKEELGILFGYDKVPGFKPGYFFQAWKDFDAPEEKCVEDKGMLNGITIDELNEKKKKYSVSNEQESNKQFWIN